MSVARVVAAGGPSVVRDTADALVRA